MLHFLLLHKSHSIWWFNGTVQSGKPTCKITCQGAHRFVFRWTRTLYQPGVNTWCSETKHGIYLYTAHVLQTFHHDGGDAMSPPWGDIIISLSEMALNRPQKWNLTIIFWNCIGTKATEFDGALGFWKGIKVDFGRAITMTKYYSRCLKGIGNCATVYDGVHEALKISL